MAEYFFHDLYLEVFRDEKLFFNVSLDKLNKSFIKLKRAYTRKALKKGETYVDYHMPSERCAYLYKFGPCHTLLVSVYFKKFLEMASNVSCVLGKKDKLKICCLGGGPGTEFVGMFEALTYYENLWTKLSEVTVLDICGGWRHTFKRIIEKLKEFYPSHKNLSSQLLSVNLMDTLSDPALTAVEEADIILMVKFVSTVISHPSAESAFKELASHMKAGAVVFFIDNLDNRIFKPLKKYFSESGLICVFRDFCDNFKVQGSYSLANCEDATMNSDTMAHANVYVLGWIKQSSPELMQSASHIYSTNSQEDSNYNCQESDWNPDNVLCNFQIKEHGDYEGSNLSWDDLSNTEENGYSDQCTQTTEDSGESSSYQEKNGCDNLSSDELLGCYVDRSKLCTNQYTQTVKFLCDESSPCTNHADIKSLGRELSKIALCLDRIESLIRNIAVGCSNKCCSETAHCSDVKCDTSDDCHGVSHSHFKN